eukprot:CAMPEP_0197654526 /NCGR_PEP_ID=MMETSP1338-20131121/38897_1 /TAXON_ID=43686 ORGANISM="Pelagodinium beii, Strain RCC1491" /NCGR_SAMPLE_ID=MMETSP1338 /ASSEMBLY_ACC=CAM_ASM_000754 /LENGTH=165 /DNA_ID=CAMNT_0043229979 /DNA_START=212 /DNA_END=710 /DNA_ORIENTATION=+
MRQAAQSSLDSAYLRPQVSVAAGAGTPSASEAAVPLVPEAAPLAVAFDRAEVGTAAAGAGAGLGAAVGAGMAAAGETMVQISRTNLPLAPSLNSSLASMSRSSRGVRRRLGWAERKASTTESMGWFFMTAVIGRRQTGQSLFLRIQSEQQAMQKLCEQGASATHL